jgi:mono/diheme cytochrome c family protein
MGQNEYSKIEVYLDADNEPIATYKPPAQMELDTSMLEDGEHTIKFIALDAGNKRSVKKINFVVRNGPGIAVDGLKENDVVEGKLKLILNSFGGAYQENWEPNRAETPAPIPTWMWIIFISIAAWSMFYFINQWNPSQQYANTPTYRSAEILPSDNIGISNISSINGAEIYRKSCSSCHQENGQGLPKVFPSLVGNDVVLSDDPSEQIKTILFGLNGKTINGVKYNTPMPGMADQLSDEEVAAVINHERSSWGNNSRLIKPEQVHKIRINKN